VHVQAFEKPIAWCLLVVLVGKACLGVVRAAVSNNNIIQSRVVSFFTLHIRLHTIATLFF